MKFILPKIFLGIERWKWNKEYRVYVSNMGHFKDEYKEDLPFKTTTSGYLNVKTRCGYKLAHRLVMLTWRPIPGAEDLTVDHLDHNKRNNALTNLEWVTREENLRRAGEDHLDNEMAELPVPTVQVTVKKKKKKKSKEIERGTIQHFKTPADAAEWAMTLPELASNETVKVETIRKNVKRAAKNKTPYLGFTWEIDSVTQSENQKKKNAEAKAKAAAEEIVVAVTLDPEEEKVEVIVEIDEDEEIEYVEVVINCIDEFVSYDTSKSMFYIQSNAPPN